MEYRILGRTGLRVSEIGLGTELLAKKQSPERVREVVRAAIEHGINYFDILVMHPDFLRAAGEAMREHRESVVIAGHFGTGIIGKRPSRLRRIPDAIASFNQMLKCLGVKSVDVAMLQYVNAKEYPMFLKPGGLVDAMKALQKEDKVRFIGISSHETPVLMDVIEGGRFDVVMTQINAACSAMPERQVLFNACASRNIGLIGTKPFIGGKLFKPGKKVRLAYYQTATETIILKTPTGITPACCLAHALKQPGVSSVIPGMQSVPEIESSLAYYTASPAARDDAKLVTLFTGHT